MKAYNNSDYKLGDETDAQSKFAYQLLHEIELNIHGKMNEIKYI
jgi:hypothetical protein